MFFYGALTRFLISFAHSNRGVSVLLFSEKSYETTLTLCDAHNAATTAPLLHCPYRGELRPKFERIDSSPKHAGGLSRKQSSNVV